MFVCTRIVECASGSVAIAFSSAGVPIFRASLPNRRCVMPMPARAPGSHGDVAFRCSLFSFQEKKNRIIEWLLERHSHIQIYDNIYLLSGLSSVRLVTWRGVGY